MSRKTFWPDRGGAGSWWTRWTAKAGRTDHVKIRVRNWLRHPIVSLDVWWERKAPTLRLDHYPANLFLLVGLIFWTISVIRLGPAEGSPLRVMPPWLELSMAVCILVGCLVKLHGVLSHSRFWFSNTPLRRCYQLGYTGAPIAASGLFVYGWYILEHTPTWTSALAGLLAPLLGAGILLQGCVYWLESRRLEHFEHRMISIAKQVKDIADDGG